MRIARDLHPSHTRPAPPIAHGLPGDFDEGRFRSRIERSDFAAELFVSPAHAAWQRGRYALRKDDRPDALTDISGVRFQACDPKREDRSLERETQTDVTALVAAVRDLRTLPGLAGAVLLGDDLRATQPIRGKGSRVKFGLHCPPGDQTRDDAVAAARCHRALRRAIRRSRLVVLEPRKFDPKAGLAGLQAWGGQLLLRRRRPWWPWLLPLLLLPLLLLDCQGPQSFLGFSIGTRSLLVVVDKSGSMQRLFPMVQAEAKRTLTSMQAGWFGRRYADVIVYDGHAESALGGLQPIDPHSEARLNGFLDHLVAGGDTNLGSALALAAQEVKQHGQPTTLVILTDGEGDASIRAALADPGGLLASFAGVEIIGHTITPRLLEAGSADSAPATEDERALADLARGLGGTFGPRNAR